MEKEKIDNSHLFGIFTTKVIIKYPKNYPLKDVVLYKGEGMFDVPFPRIPGFIGNNNPNSRSLKDIIEENKMNVDSTLGKE